MKRTILYALSLIFILVSCRQEDSVTDEAGGVGYLVLQYIHNASAQFSSASCRAASVDEDLTVRISGSNFDTTYEAGSFPEKVTLDEGDYTLTIYNDAYEQDEDAAKYYLEDTLTIVQGEISYKSYEVPIVNLGVNVSLPSQFGTYIYLSSFTVVSTVDGAEVDSSVITSDEDTAWVDYADGATLTCTLVATNRDNEEFTDAVTLTDVTAGTVYTISYSWAED